MKLALYEVTIGFIDEDGNELDNWRDANVHATDAIKAARKVRLRRGEYVAGVGLIGRATK